MHVLKLVLVTTLAGLLFKDRKMSIKEVDILERIAEAIDVMDTDDLARTYNHLTSYPAITGDDIELCEGWHLVPKEGGH